MSRLLQDYVVRGAQRAPDRHAVTNDGARVSYGRLDERSNRIAHMLRSIGCRRGDRVVVCSAASVDTLAEQIGVLKAGCVYVPDEADGRAVQRARVVREVRPVVVLFRDCHPMAVDDLRLRGALGAAKVGWLGSEPADVAADFGDEDLDGASAAPVRSDGSADDLAVLLYGSGRPDRTGPTELTHRAIMGIAEWARDYFALGPTDRVCAHHPPVSGMAMLYTWATLAAGARVQMVPSWLYRVPHEISRFSAGAALTLWSSAGSLLEYAVRFGALGEHPLPALRHVAWSGYGLPGSALAEWRKHVPGATFTRVYSPSPDSLPLSHYRVPDDFDDGVDDVPIGGGLGDHRLAVLDDELHPLAQGSVGAVFATRADGVPLRTGHRGRHGTDGVVRLAGSGDFDLPSGLSELGTATVEHAILELDGVAACAIIPLPANDPSPNGVGCAYVTSNGRPLRETEARRRLSERLPPQAIPSRWLALPELPVDRWGRIDRARASALLGG